MRPIAVLALSVVIFFLPAKMNAQEPISLEVLLDGVPSHEGGWVLTVTLLAQIDLDQADLTVETSKGLRLTAGNPHWQGRLPAGGEALLELSFSLNASPPKTVTIRAQGRTRKGIPFEKKVIRSINTPSP